MTPAQSMPHSKTFAKLHSYDAYGRQPSKGDWSRLSREFGEIAAHASFALSNQHARDQSVAFEWRSNPSGRMRAICIFRAAPYGGSAGHPRSYAKLGYFPPALHHVRRRHMCSPFTAFIRTLRSACVELSLSLADFVPIERLSGHSLEVAGSRGTPSAGNLFHLGIAAVLTIALLLAA